VCTIPPGLAYCDGVSDVRLVIHHIMFCVKVLVIQVLSCSCVRLAVHHPVARWIHLCSVRFVYIDELLAGLMFPRLQVTCIAHVIGRSIRSIGWEGASWKIGPNNPYQSFFVIMIDIHIDLLFLYSSRPCGRSTYQSNARLLLQRS
jgi:hypothetical protein